MRKWILFVAVIGLSCSPKNNTREVTDPGNGGGDDPGSDPGPSPLPAPYTSLTWDMPMSVEIGSLLAKAGYQGKLLRGGDGTFYYAYYKDHGGHENTCDIAVFSASDPAPGINYDLRVATLTPGGSSWSVETVPLDQVGAGPPYVTNRYGIDGVVDTQGHLVLAFAGGASAIATCGSGDLVVATRSAPGAWSFQQPVTSSGACCTYPDPCSDPACTSGDAVGAWAAVTLDGSNHLAVAYADHHFAWDNDGFSKRGLELWEQAGSRVTGIRPWSGKASYMSLRYAAPHAGAASSGLIVAYTSFSDTGMFVSRRVGTTGLLADWVETDLKPDCKVGERPSLAVAPDGTVGIAFYLSQNATPQAVGDLIYCQSNDNGETWQPCETVDSLNTVGQYPSLAFDKENRPVVSYYYCGVAGNCDLKYDGVRYAWRDDATNKWSRFNAYFDAATMSGVYNQLVVDPDTDEPTIAFQDVTHGAAMVVRGHLQ